MPGTLMFQCFSDKECGGLQCKVIIFLASIKPANTTHGDMRWWDVV